MRNIMKNIRKNIQKSIPKDVVLACACIGCVLWTPVDVRSQAQTQTEIISAPSTSKSTAVTVYNDGFSLVRQVRPIKLKKGMNTVRYEGIASTIDATSVQLSDTKDPQSLAIREQNYQYDVLTPLSVLQKSVGSSLRFRRMSGSSQWETLEGTLLNPPEMLETGGQYRGMVIKAKDNSIILNPQGEITLDAIPAGLVPSPSLMWKLQSATEAARDIEVGYLCSGMEWSADYVAVLAADDASLNLNGWVTIKNNTGSTFSDASLQLVAGKVRRVRNEYVVSDMIMTRNAMGSVAPPSFQEESFFDYHLYTLDGTTTLQSNETKQMRLLSAANVKSAKRLIFDEFKCSPVQRQPGDGSATTEYNAAIMVECTNSKESNMGMPLPQGKVRVYKADSEGRLQFVGEDRVSHTAVNEPVRLYLGDAFDVIATKVVKETKVISRRSQETTIEVVIRNRKTTPESISVYDHFSSEWTVVNSSVKPRRVDARTAEFDLNLDANATTVLSYTIRQSW
jgi:hypothetical protein